VHRTASAASRRWRRTEGGEDQDVAALADASHELSQPRRSVVGDPSIFVMDGLYLCVLGGQRMCMTLSSPAELLARSYVLLSRPQPTHLDHLAAHVSPSAQPSRVVPRSTPPRPCPSAHRALVRSSSPRAAAARWFCRAVFCLPR
jgi:hypothetical protein